MLSIKSRVILFQQKIKNFDPKFVSLSKFNPGHTNFFDSGVFDSFP
jgi:hypothetical protein